MCTSISRVSLVYFFLLGVDGLGGVPVRGQDHERHREELQVLRVLVLPEGRSPCLRQRSSTGPTIGTGTLVTKSKI